MSTLVGTQQDFHKALYELCELDFDTVRAYKAALERLGNEEYKAQLRAFMKDYLQHIEDVTNLLERHNVKAPIGPSSKQILTEGKVIFANIFGDAAILKAIFDVEVDTNTAYERLLNRQDKWIDADDILNRGLNDAQFHKSWIEQIIK